MLRQATARNHANVSTGTLELSIGTFDSLPWDGESFDKVLIVNVVYFFDRDRRDIAEVFRVLRIGGQVVIFATGRSSMWKWKFSGAETHRTFDVSDSTRLLE